MNKKLINIISFIAAFMLAACSQNSNETFDDKAIALNAGIVEATSTRAIKTDEVRGNVPSDKYPLNALICFGTESKVYKHAPTEPSYLPCRTTINYTSGNKTYPTPYDGNPLKYPQDNSLVYCVGLHPQTGWTFTDNSNVTFPIDGRSDIMFAPEIIGKWELPFDAQTYTHLQAWMKITICATAPEAIEAWGDIDSIAIKSKAQVEINLGAETDSLSFENNGIKYSGEKCIGIVKKSDNVKLETHIKEVGQFFYVPLNMAAEDTIIIKTRNKELKKIPFKLIDKNNKTISHISKAIGKLYIVELEFQPFDLIKAECTLDSWDAWDDNLYLE